MSVLTLPGYRMPGEFEPHEGCLLIWPSRPGSWPYEARAAREAFRKVIAAITASEHVWVLAGADCIDNARQMLSEVLTVVPADADPADASLRKAGSVTILPLETDDAWARDVGPTVVVRDADTFCNSNRMAISTDSLDTDMISAASVGSDSTNTAMVSAASVGSDSPDTAMVSVASDSSHASGDTDTPAQSSAPARIGIDWKFNAWGGDVDGLYPHWDKDDAAAAAFSSLIGMHSCDAHPFVLEGGSIHSDGEGTLMVTEACLLSEGRNPDLTKEEISEILCNTLGCQKILWLPRGIYNDETNEHVDNVAAFVRPGEIVLAWTDDENDPQYALSKADLDYLETETDAKGRKLKVHKLYIPAQAQVVREEDLGGYVFEDGEDVRDVGERLAASYVNFYISNRGIIVPQFGDANDEKAVQLLGELFPERTVYPIPARDILLGGGNIHCITQQIPLSR